MIDSFTFGFFRLLFVFVVFVVVDEDGDGDGFDGIDGMAGGALASKGIRACCWLVLGCLLLVVVTVVAVVVTLPLLAGDSVPCPGETLTEGGRR